MRSLIYWLVLLLTLCVASGRWRHRKKNSIFHMRHTSRARRPAKKSVVHEGVKFSLVPEEAPRDDCELGPIGCHRYSEIINANPETRESHNSEKGDKDLLKNPSYKDLPRETAERIKELMEERIKMLSSNESEGAKASNEKETKSSSGSTKGGSGCTNITKHDDLGPYDDTAVNNNISSSDNDTIKIQFSGAPSTEDESDNTSTPHHDTKKYNKLNPNPLPSKHKDLHEADEEKQDIKNEGLLHHHKEDSLMPPLIDISSDLNMKLHDADDDDKELPDLHLIKSKPREVTPIRENFAESLQMKELNKSIHHQIHRKVPFNPKKRAFSSNKTEVVAGAVPEHNNGDTSANIAHYSLYTTSVRGLLPLPPLEELVDLNEKQMKYKHNGCDIKVTNVQCIMELNLRSKKCENVVSLPSLYDTLTRGSLRRVADKFINLDVFQVTTVSIDRCKKDITFETVAKEPFNFLSGVEGTKVLDATLALDMNYEGSFGFEQLGFKVTGEAKVDGDTWLMSLTKARGLNEGKFAIDATKIKVSDFYKLFSNGAELDRGTALDVKPFTDVTIEDPKVRGVRDSKGTDEIVVAGNFKEIAGMGEASLYIIVERKAFKPVSVAVTFNPKAIEPASVLYNLVGVNLKEVPLLSGVRMGMVVEYSNNDIEKPVDSMLVRTLLKYVTNSMINKGTRIKVIAPVRDILKYKGVRTPKIHDTYIQMIVQEDVIKFKFPEDPLMDLSQILIALVPSVPEVLFKKILVTPPQIKITKYDVDIKMKNTSAVIEAPMKFPLGNNLIEVDSARFDLKHQDGKPWEFSLKAKKKIGNAMMDLSIKKESDQFVLAGSGVDVGIKQLIESFNVKAGVAEIIKEAPYLNFEIKDMKLNAQFGGKQKIMLHGTADFLKEKAVFEGALMEFPSKTSLSIGLVLNDVSLDDLGSKMFKDYKPIRGAGWLSGLTASIVSSNSDSVKDITFANEILKENKIVELLESPLMKQCYQFEELETRVWYPWKDKASCHTGVSFGAKVKLPQDCMGENICSLLSKNFGTDHEIYLKGVISSAVLQLKTSLNGHIAMSDDLQIRDVAVLISVGKQNMISVNGKMRMKLDSKDFDFEASIGYNPTGRLDLVLSMDSVYEKPLGLQYVSLAGLNMNAGIDGNNVNTHFEVNGKMLLGVLGDQMAMDISGALDNNAGGAFYFFSRLKEPSISRLKRAFGIKTQIPKVLEETSFQGEVIVGSTSNPNGTNIPFMEVDLTNGLFFRGLFNIFGFSIKSQIEVTHPGKMSLRGLLPKMDLAEGLIKVKNADDKAAGLGMGGELNINVDNQGSSVVIDGVVDLLDMTSPTRMEISDKGMEMVVNGRYLNMIDARVIVNAPNGKLLKIPESKYMASSCLESIIPNVANAAKDLVEDGVKISTEATKEVKKQIENAAVWYQKASTKYDGIKAKVRQMEEKVQEKTIHFEAMKKVLEEKCVDRCRPNRTWVGGFDEREYTFAGKKIKCPVWKEKRRLRYAPGCLIACEGNKIIEKSNALQKKVAISILRKLTKTQSTVLESVQTFVDAARNVVEMTEQSSRKVADIASDGKKAVEYIKNFGADNIFNINKICFGTTLKVANEGCLIFSVDVNFGGKTGKHFLYDTETTCLNRNYANSVAEQIVYFGKFFPGLKFIKEKIAQTKSNFKKGEDEASKMEGKYKEVLEAELEVDTKTKDIIKKSTLNPMDDIGEELNELPELPSVVLRNDYTMKAFRDMFSDEDDIRDSTADDNDEGDNEGSGDENLFAKVDVTIDINELQKSTADKCSLIDNVINAYANIGNGAIILSDHNQNEKDKYQGFLSNITQETLKADNLVVEACKKANLTAGETDNALFYAKKSKDDITDYEKWLQHKFDLLDKSSLGSWRSLMSDMVADKGIELTSFLKILNAVSVEAARRHDVPNTKYQLGESLRYAEKIVNDLLLGDDDTLSSKRESIKDLQDQVMYMKQVKKEMDCKT